MARVAGPRPRSTDVVGLQRRRDGAERDAVVGLERRGLALAEVAAAPVEPDVQDVALAQLAPRGAQRRPQREPRAASPRMLRHRLSSQADPPRAARRTRAGAARCPPARR